MKFKLFIFLTFTFITHSLFANVGSYIIQGTGGSLLPIKNNSINMEKEEIKINVFLLAFNSFQINYDCTFYLKNATDSKQTTLIGFPHKLDVHMIQGNSREAGYVVASKDPAIEDFKFIINEREISFGIYPVQLKPDLSTVPAYDVVYATELAFSPGENKIIKITFTINKYLNCIPTPMGYPLEDRENIEYILKTGLTWKNPIGKADIIINFHFPEKYITVSGKPEGYSINENPLQIKYSFSNFVPSEDIKLDFAFNKLSSDNCHSAIQLLF